MLEKPGSRTMDQASAPLMLFVTVAEVRAAVPSWLVRGVMRPRPATRLGTAPAWCLGATTFRGDLVPVVDLASLLFAVPDPDVKRLVVLEVGGAGEPRRLGVLVREVLGLGPLGAAHTLPSVLSVSGAVDAATLDESLTLVLEPTRLVSEADWAELANAHDGAG